ncbi:MAG TPA: hypothetical protein VE641_16920 [Chthoniobacterales bacterium]|jgi:uncharacterized protein YjgD (DUF1641 family)|nr:hypothetical protein [Chthoniobacterales bacterium]
MAKPTCLISKRRGPQADAQTELESAPLQHADAILDAYETIQAFHDAGVFDFLKGLAGAQKQIMGQLANTAKTPEMVRGLRNLLILAKSLGNIDPNRFEAIAKGVAKAMQPPDSDRSKPPGSLNLLTRSRSKEARSALGLAVDVLESVGRELGHGERRGTSIGEQ